LAGSLSGLDELHGRFDLALSSEVLQRMEPAEREPYVGRLLELAPRVALFAPNFENEAHVGRSGLGSLGVDDLRRLVEKQATAGAEIRSGYLDIPPFPPGITRTSSQRQGAASGRIEALAMWGLGIYARAERLLPPAARRRWAHIVYILYNA
jgi:hypothetical protein